MEGDDATGIGAFIAAIAKHRHFDAKQIRHAYIVRPLTSTTQESRHG